VEQCAGHAIYSMMDLFVGFDHHALAEESCNITTFQTPRGTYHLMVLPQGWTDSPAVFQNDVALFCKLRLTLPQISKMMLMSLGLTLITRK
jgi:hypothetical protein